jgi:uncharacterized protein
MSQPFKLFRLQQVDSHLDQNRARVAEIDRILNSDLRLKEARNKVESTENVLQEARKGVRGAEEEVKAQQIKLEQNEAALYGGKVRNPKELQDLQNESAALKRYLAVLEDRQLEQMLLVEDAEAEHSQATQALEAVQRTVTAQQEVLVNEKTGLVKDIERLESERQAAASTIEAEDMQLYTQLRRQRMGVAVAKVSDRNCAACGSTLTPGTIQTAQLPNQITRCTFCGRILYAG